MKFHVLKKHAHTVCRVYTFFTYRHLFVISVYFDLLIILYCILLNTYTYMYERKIKANQRTMYIKNNIIYYYNYLFGLMTNTIHVGNENIFSVTKVFTSKKK